MARPPKLNLEEVIPVIEKGVAKKESKVAVAKRLGVSRNTLHYWIANIPEIKNLFN